MCKNGRQRRRKDSTGHKQEGKENGLDSMVRHYLKENAGKRRGEKAKGHVVAGERRGEAAGRQGKAGRRRREAEQTSKENLPGIVNDTAKITALQHSCSSLLHQRHISNVDRP